MSDRSTAVYIDPASWCTVMNIDAVNKWLTAVQSIAVIAAVVVAVWQLSEISGQGKIQAQTLRQTQQAASAILLLQIRDKLDGQRYAAIAAAIQEHDHTYALLRGGGKGGKFSDGDVAGYLGNFEDIAYLSGSDFSGPFIAGYGSSREGLIIPEMAYYHFSHDVEKAWCNGDVQHVIRQARESDKSATADPFYARLETLALTYLTREGQSCKDIDNQ
jgi:hypothetical protein